MCQAFFVVLVRPAPSNQGQKQETPHTSESTHHREPIEEERKAAARETNCNFVVLGSCSSMCVLEIAERSTKSWCCVNSSVVLATALPRQPKYCWVQTLCPTLQ